MAVTASAERNIASDTVDLDAWASATLRASSGTLWWAIRLLCTPSEHERFCRLYGYFRWADDLVDAPDRDPKKARAFVARQRRVLDGHLSPEHVGERAVLAAMGDDAPALVAPAVDGMLAALTFDAGRDQRPMSQAELDAQVMRVGDAYLAGILACSGHEGEVPEAALPLSRAATAAHYVRDLFIDRELGYLNVPREAAERLGIDAGGFDEESVAPYAVERLAEIEAWFRDGRPAVAAASTRRARALVRLLTIKYGRLARRLAAHYRKLLVPDRPMPRE